MIAKPSSLYKPMFSLPNDIPRWFKMKRPTNSQISAAYFDVTMGSYGGAKICELVGLFIVNHLGKSFGKENIGLYRDDGLAIIKNKSARLADKTRKELHKAFEQFGLKITANQIYTW